MALQNIKIDFVYRNPPRYLNTDYREGHTINRDKTRKYSLRNFLFKILRKEGKPCENVCNQKGSDRPPAEVLPPLKKEKILDFLYAETGGPPQREYKQFRAEQCKSSS